MKQLWLSIVLLVLLLAAGIVTSYGVRWVQEPIAAQLEQAADAGFSGNWQQAEALSSAAKARWDTYRNALATIADHGPMEEIDGLFGQLEFHLQAKDAVLFSGLCRRLSLLTQAIGEAHTLSWWNLL